MSDHIFIKNLLAISVIAGSMTSGPLYAEWPSNQPEPFNAPKIGDFPPENIDELLRQGNPDFSRSADTVPVEAPPMQPVTQQAAPSAPAPQHGLQSGQQTGLQTPQYATQQPAYGASPYGGQGWNRGYGYDRSRANGPRGNRSWNNSPWGSGNGFNMPWGNNRSGFSPWNGNWGGNNWGNRRNSGAPWSNNGSGFNMPWGDSNSGFSPWNSSWGKR